jgi:hypothetical protein
MTLEPLIGAPANAAKFFTEERALWGKVITVSISLSGLKLGEGYPLVLRLRMPFARSPQELHISDDTRRLAVGLVSVRFDN